MLSCHSNMIFYYDLQVCLFKCVIKWLTWRTTFLSRMSTRSSTDRTLRARCVCVVCLVMVRCVCVYALNTRTYTYTHPGGALRLSHRSSLQVLCSVCARVKAYTHMYCHACPCSMVCGAYIFALSVQVVWVCSIVELPRCIVLPSKQYDLVPRVQLIVWTLY